MRLVNETSLEVELLRTILSDQLMVATLVAKVCYELGEDGRLIPAARHPKVLLEATEVDGVELPADAGYGKAGIDLLVIGSAHAPGGRPRRAMIAGVAIDEHEYGLAIIGDRRWERSWTGWSMSDPDPFVEMPMDWSRAYGGHARVQGGEVPCVDNPVGRGYILELDGAEGVALPNVEDPTALIRDIRDRPRPVSFHPLPMGTSYAADALAEARARGRNVSRAMFNSAIPTHRLPRYPAGAELRLCNLTPRPAPGYVLPNTSMIAEVTIGGARRELQGEIDTILLRPARRELVLTHRIVFRYHYARERPRVVRVRCSELERPGAAPQEAVA